MQTLEGPVHGTGEERALLKLLRLAARGIATIDPARSGGDCGPSLDGGLSGAIAQRTWDNALANKMIGREPGSDTWRITRRGRTYLKRALSTCDAGRLRCSAKSVKSAHRPAVNDSESPLAWLRRRRDKDGEPMISQAQFDAGERLRADFHFAQMTPRITVNWSAAFAPSASRRCAPGAGADMQDHVVAAAERVRRALAAVGPELSGVLIDVCCHLKGLEQAEREAGWPMRTARVVLLLALTGLARHYGIEREASAVRSGCAIRHWGAEGYRPSLDPSDAEPAG
jgi:hypothetical protein